MVAERFQRCLQCVRRAFDERTDPVRRQARIAEGLANIAIAGDNPGAQDVRPVNRRLRLQRRHRRIGIADRVGRQRIEENGGAFGVGHRGVCGSGWRVSTLAFGCRNARAGLLRDGASRRGSANRSSAPPQDEEKLGNPTTDSFILRRALRRPAGPSRNARLEGRNGRLEGQNGRLEGRIFPRHSRFAALTGRGAGDSPSGTISRQGPGRRRKHRCPAWTGN